MEILKMFFVLMFFAIFFLILNKLEKSQKIRSELNRKILHIGTGICALALPFLFQNKMPVISLGVFFIIILLIIRFSKSKALKIDGFKNVIDLKTRKTYGDVYFVISIIGLWIVKDENEILYFLPLIIFMFSDAFAALIGEFYGKYKFNTGFGIKSIEGSTIFFITTYFVCSNFFLLYSNLKNTNIVLLSLLLSILSMLLELISWNGLDNFFIPLFSYLFLKLNLDLTAEELIYKFFVISVLFLIVFLNRKKTTLTRVAQTGSLFFMYLVTILGGIKWLIPALMLYLGYYHFTPKVKGQIKDSLKGLLSIGLLGFFWIVLSIKLNKEMIFFIYIFVFSLYFGIINFIRYNAVYLGGRGFNIKFFYISVEKSIIFFAINYILLSRMLDLKMLISSVLLIITGIILYEIIIEKFYVRIVRNSYGGENKVFLMTAIVFFCGMVLLGIARL